MRVVKPLHLAQQLETEARLLRAARLLLDGRSTLAKQWRRHADLFEAAAAQIGELAATIDVTHEEERWHGLR
jgi:hypothetical protein